MKVYLLFALTSLILYSCPHNRDDIYYSDYEPENMERSAFENSITLSKTSGNANVKNAGKIYLKDNYMFIGDTNKGFYIYNNNTPEKPTLIAFLKIPGATDLAIRGDIMYVNQAVDLVAFSFDLSQNKITIHDRIRNTFPVLRSPDGYYPISSEGKVVVDWHKRVKHN
ncbi:hypothetical protein [Capnocytophaga felis]|uniref:LVIVD repeat-containing protein n=1 Tax=Capnocytophaga felis TaxID=2267611 RepID=A0A5M4B795_9FLAO|nr:hypothetical protein [Capnocytophaga felis]GET45474.1 hypothetical protein RCZ01_07760 [Capnocytophaga felis]GET47363.1 hypothetical protein RCZ02_01940 [Capnocytophaga felis]